MDSNLTQLEPGMIKRLMKMFGGPTSRVNKYHGYGRRPIPINNPKISADIDRKYQAWLAKREGRAV